MTCGILLCADSCGTLVHAVRGAREGASDDDEEGGGVTQLSRQELIALSEALRVRVDPVLPADVSRGEATAGIYSQLEGTINERVGAGESLLEVVCEVGELVLSDVQDRVARDLKTGWPPSYPGHPVEASGGDLPLPETAIVGDELHLWFGEKGFPALVLDPIPLSVLNRT